MHQPPPATSKRSGPFRPYLYLRKGNRVRKITSTTRNVRQSNTRGLRNISFSERIVNDISSLRPDFYAAPSDAIQITSFPIETSIQYLGWQLYYSNETLNQASILSNRINVIKEHYKNYPSTYILEQIRCEYSFQLQGKLILNDPNITTAWPDLRHDMEKRTIYTLSAFSFAMHSLLTTTAVEKCVAAGPSLSLVYHNKKEQLEKIFVRPIDFVEATSIAAIETNKIDKIFCFRGVVSAIGSVQTKCLWIAYRCNRCGHQQAIRQGRSFPAKPTICHRNDCLSKNGFKDLRSSPHTQIKATQIIRAVEVNTNIQEEHINTLDIKLSADMVDNICIGDCIDVTGILKIKPLCEEQPTSSNANGYKCYLDALSIKPASQTDCKDISAKDVEAMNFISKEPTTLKVLVHSLAPEIHGHEMVKTGVLLSLFGGAGSQVQNGNNINILLVGDPGVGKSYLIQTASKLSERGIYISGKGVCNNALNGFLTATVQEKSFPLGAGTLFSSADGHCSIDDIDKLPSHQEHLLQVMETSRFSLLSTNLSSNFLNSSSVIAAANSVRGHFDRSKLFMENVRFCSSLIFQFHLIFVLLDTPNKDLDSSLTEHIKALHSGKKKSNKVVAEYLSDPRAVNSLNMELEETYDLADYLKFNIQHGEELDLVPMTLLKKYIVYARQKFKPMLTSEAIEELKQFYWNLRKESSDTNFTTVNTSNLEKLISLTQARARIDFCTKANRQHVRDVISLVRKSMADTSVGDYVDVNPAGSAVANQGSQVRKFVRMLQVRSSALGRTVFEFDEIKDMARHAGMSCGVTNLIDFVNMQGLLLKKGPNLYEFISE